MGLGVWFLAGEVSVWLMGGHGLVTRLAILCGIVAAGGLIYLVLLLLLKVTSLAQLKAGFRRG
jgi:hypothetical protein